MLITILLNRYKILQVKQKQWQHKSGRLRLSLQNQWQHKSGRLRLSLQKQWQHKSGRFRLSLQKQWQHKSGRLVASVCITSTGEETM